MKKINWNLLKSKWGWMALILMLVLALGGGMAGTAVPVSQEPAPFSTRELPPEALTVDENLRAQMAGFKNPYMDSSLAQLTAEAQRSMDAALAWAEAQNLRIADGRVQVQVAASPENLEAAVAAIEAAGGEVTVISNDRTLVQCWVPVTALEALSQTPAVDYIRQPAQVILMDEASINATSEGLTPMNVPAWHGEGYTGSGVKVAIIDGGFTGYTALLGTDLPSSVTPKNFVDGENDPGDVDGGTPHGTACAEIVHDIAPNASLYLIKISTNLDLQEAVTYAIAQNVDIISTSIGWYNLTPGDGTGQFADMVQTARDNGILWLTAAGNDREAHWGGAFNGNGDTIHDFNAGHEINMYGPTGTTSCYDLNPGHTIYVFMRWDDWTDVDQNYDLYFLRLGTSGWTVVAASENPQNGGGGQTPTEMTVYTTSGSATCYAFVVARINSTRNVNLEIFSPKVTELQVLLHNRSLANLADAPDALTVAALDVSSPYPQEEYSSEGPTNGPGGTASGGFTKPDISGFANVSTEAYGAGVFNGTSSATPHVAGAAALVLSAFPTYTPADLESYLTTNAIDMGSSGMDNLFGHGRVYLDTPPENTRTPFFLPLIIR
jgi:subtilisin family serine protease